MLDLVSRQVATIVAIAITYGRPFDPFSHIENRAPVAREASCPRTRSWATIGAAQLPGRRLVQLSHPLRSHDPERYGEKLQGHVSPHLTSLVPQTLHKTLR